jgi:[ribosomal protein S5]-alanine N-acetyltransferase
MSQNKKLFNKGYKYKPIKTERLELVKPDLKYTDANFKLYSDKRIWKYNGAGNNKFTKAEVTKQIKRKMKEWKKRESLSFFILCNGRFIGSIGAYEKIIDFESCAIGYMIAYDYWNKGYATEALSAYIKWVFKNTIINRIQAVVATPHLASIKVLRKNGFRREGTLKEAKIFYGKKYDDYVFGLLKKEYFRKNK